MLEREAVPGGRAGAWSAATGGYHLDTGPTGAHHARPVRRLLRRHRRGARRLARRCCRSTRPTARGSPTARSLDVHADPDAMAARDRARSAGPPRPTATAATSTYVAELYRLQMRDFIDRNFDSPLDLRRPDAGRLAAMRRVRAGWRRPSPGTSPTSGCDGCSASRRCTPGVSPYAGARRSTPSSPTWTSVAGVCFPVGRHARGAPRAGRRRRRRRGRHPVRHRGQPRCELRRARGSARCRRRRRAVAADAVVAHPRPARGPQLLGLPGPRPAPAATPRRCVVLHLAGLRHDLPGDQAHHTIGFGERWRGVFDELTRGPAHERPVVCWSRMPVARPTRSLAPDGRQC